MNFLICNKYIINYSSVIIILQEICSYLLPNFLNFTHISLKLLPSPCPNTLPALASNSIWLLLTFFYYKLYFLLHHSINLNFYLRLIKTFCDPTLLDVFDVRFSYKDRKCPSPFDYWLLLIYLLIIFFKVFCIKLYWLCRW